MNTDVDNYFVNGCGRCADYATPNCKVHLWTKGLSELRRIVLSCGLNEEAKWGMPCYTFQNKNVIMISAFKANASLSFFKGALLQDAEGLLQKPGENSQSARLFKFTTAQEVLNAESTLRAYIFEAIELERAGLAVEFKIVSEFDIPPEFQKAMNDQPKIKSAFEALTPGRQRGYLLHFAQAKQSKTRESRIQKCLPKIFEGKGFNER
ncbi:YdeI/OmpD-associated family protein [Reichenbachiella sp.]|uniref:YdeI/OmpD-associated family protein n=1 Tax=Reichenbachiella sp. TaxID=2184521 RepID=UPI003B5B184E